MPLDEFPTLVSSVSQLRDGMHALFESVVASVVGIADRRTCMNFQHFDQENDQVFEPARIFDVLTKSDVMQGGNRAL